MVSSPRTLDTLLSCLRLRLFSTQLTYLVPSEQRCRKCSQVSQELTTEGTTAAARQGTLLGYSS